MFRRKPSDFSNELRAHLDLEADRLRREGLGEEEARATARRNVGNIAATEERSYEASPWMWLERLGQDLRLAARQMRRSPGFTAVAVLTLALGIGANTAIFTLVEAVMLRSLPVASPETLYRLGDGNNCCVNSGYQVRFSLYPYRLFTYLRDHTPEFQMSAFQAGPQRMSVRRSGASGPSEAVVGEFVSANYFPVLGIGAAAGRTLGPADDAAGAAPAAVLSYRLWEERFGLEASVIGSSILVDGVTFTIAGVAPRGFFGETLRVDPPDLWVPLAQEPLMRGVNSLTERADQQWLYVIGRLAPGSSRAALESKVNVELQQWFSGQAGAQAKPEIAGMIARQHITVSPAGGGIAALKENYAASLRLLMMVTGLVLLIACANIANLLLARGTAAQVQNSIRIALGAPRSRLVRQALTESVVLALAGGAAGMLVAWMGSRALLLLAFGGSQVVPIDASPSAPVVAFTFLVALGTGIAFGIAPAWSTSAVDPADALRGAGRSAANGSSLPQKALVVLQAALSLALLAGAGLLTESFRNLENQPFGFVSDGRQVVKVVPALAGYSPERLAQVYTRLEQRLARTRGVVSASLSLYSPLEGNNWQNSISLEGRPAVTTGTPDTASWDRVSERYFETIGTRLLAGRAFGPRDTGSTPHVAIVSEAFVQKFFPNQNPLGRHFGMGGIEHRMDYEIVGVVEDAKYHAPREPVSPMYFLPLLQMSEAEWKESPLARSNLIHSVQLHVTGEGTGLATAVRQAFEEVDPNLTVLTLRTLSEQVKSNFNQDRLIARLTSAFGMLALVLASVGLYGVTAYSVARRSGEIGIRIALGASRRDVVGMVLRGAFLQVGMGLAMGIPMALGVGRVLSSQLYGVKGHDPLVLGGSVVLLVATASVAGLIPARRATAIDPMRSLRSE